MNHEPIDENWIPNRDAGYRLPTLSNSFREKVLSEATDAWTEDPQAAVIPFWTMPALRLAACMTLAYFIVSFAHYGDQYSLARWQPSSPSIHPSPSQESNDQWSEIHPGLMKIRKVAASSSQRGAPEDLIFYIQRLRESVNDTNVPATGSRHNSTEIFLNPRLRNPLANSPEILKS